MKYKKGDKVMLLGTKSISCSWREMCNDSDFDINIGDMGTIIRIEKSHAGNIYHISFLGEDDSDDWNFLIEDLSPPSWKSRYTTRK